ncbi:MAG: S8 family serine peptidase [Saprospiraceae bacterium]|nr:S8 family serine peptidase [Saprospiraceae bacterium]
MSIQALRSQLLLFILMFVSLIAVSQKIFTVQLKAGFDSQVQSLLESQDSPVDSYEFLNPEKFLLNLSFKTVYSDKAILNWLNKQFFIENFQKVSTLQQRACVPNDSAYFAQYNMGLMRFDEVWCFKNSGINPLGDTLVVGVIDFGFDFTLADLHPNIFRNNLEIPDNGIDDDQNGYKDDYYGLNARIMPESDNHFKESHGTQVISVVGAQGNNKQAITGTNQNIKMLLCSAVTSDQLLKCYYYFIKMKRDYINSGGKKGAYIVSSNLSAGFDRQFPDDLPLVCQVYDSLGKVGILNVVATINDNDDIAVVGDIPGLCPSDHLITVTNTNRFDQKVFEAGYNSVHVDLGACGEEILMLNLDGKLSEESGCSFSSPHVAGAVSVLYQFCPKINILNKTQAEFASLLMKSFILSNGDDLVSLKGITSTGKRLNVLKSLEKLNSYCTNDSILTPEIGLNPSLGSGVFTLNFNPVKFGDYHVLIFNSLGQELYRKRIKFNPDTPLKFDLELTHWSTGIYHMLIEGEGLKFAESFLKL